MWENGLTGVEGMRDQKMPFHTIHTLLSEVLSKELLMYLGREGEWSRRGRVLKRAVTF